MDEHRDVTRGFLFADLRGYTAFVESRGDAAGASLLRAYRDLVRHAITPFAGAEIRTEGDSFYVTFPSASRAVGAALAIVAAATEATANDPSLPIAVGVGVHAGETQATDEGPVGSAVNIAARLAARAGAGEVLVTETVRGLTRTSGSVVYVARGIPRLKGIAEPVPVYAARAATGPRLVPSRRPRLSSTAAVGVAAVVATVAAVIVGSYALMGGGTGLLPTPSTTATASSGAVVSGSPPTVSASATSRASSEPLNLTPARWSGSSKVDLAPGRYRAADFRPPFEITLDEGWQFRVDSADLGYIELQLATRPSSALTFVRIEKLPNDACALEPTTPVSAVGAVTSWLRSQPGLEAGASVTRSFATTAIQMDLLARDEGACEFSTPRYVAIRPHEVSGVCCTGFQLNVGETASVYLFGSEAVVAAFAVAPTQSEADILIPKVDAVLEGLAIDRP